MTYSEVLELINKGYFVARLGWRESTFIGKHFPGSMDFMTVPFLYIDTTRIVSITPSTVKGRAPWVPSQCDMNATDWHIVYVDSNTSVVTLVPTYLSPDKEAYVGTH